MVPNSARSPRMYDLYKSLLQGANAVGVDLFTAYVYTDTSPFGDSAALYYQDQLIGDARQDRDLQA